MLATEALQSMAETKEPSVIVSAGKAGLTEEFFEELRTQLKRHGIVKVQLTADIAKGKAKRTIKEALALATESKVIRAVGFTVVLEKKRAN